MTTWVLLRGLARESRHWGGFGAMLQGQLPAGDRVVALDLPGNGRRWTERSPTRVGPMVAAARGELAAMRCAPPYVLVALSLGAMVAVQWSAQAPKELRGCVLINTSFGRFSPFWRRLRPDGYASLLRVALGWDSIQVENRILALTSNRASTEETALRWSAFARECPVRRANAMRQLLAAVRFRAPNGAPSVPALLLASAADRLVDAACSRDIAQAWGLPLQVHPQAGHDLPLDDPEWVIARVIAWEQGLPG